MKDSCLCLCQKDFAFIGASSSKENFKISVLAQPVKTGLEHLD